MKHLMLLILALWTSVHFIEKAYASTGDYDILIKTHTSSEIHTMFPSLEGNSKDMYYLFGWIKIKQNTKKDIKYLSSPSIAVWNNSFNTKFKALSIGYEKSYFLIPLGWTAVSEDPIQHKIKH